jgi:hypothetical protein
VTCSAEDCTFQITCRKSVDGLVYITNVCLEHGCNQLIRSELLFPSDYMVEIFKESINDNKLIMVEHMRKQTLR